MARALIATPTWGDSSTVVASSENPAAPATNLLRIQPSDYFESANANPLSLICTRSTFAPWNLVALLYTNATENATWRVRAADTAGNITAAPYYDSSKLGIGLDLDGNDDEVTVAADPVFGLDTFTFEAWIKPRVLRRQGIFKRSGGAADAILLMESDGRLRFKTSPNVDGDVSTLSPLTVDTWVHVAAIYDGVGETARIYLNGVLAATQTSVTTFSDGTALTFGGIESSRFAGGMNEVRLWQDVRTPAELIAWSGKELTAPLAEPDLVGYWRMNDASGATATDSGPNGCDGTVAGGARWKYPLNVWASPSLDQWDRRHALLWVPSGVTAKVIQIDVLDPDNSESCIRIGRLYVANAWQFKVNPQYGATPWRFTDPSTRRVTPQSQTIVGPRPRLQGAEFTVQTDSEEELMDACFELDRIRGASEDVLFVWDPDDYARRHKGMIYGLLDSGGLAAVVPAFSLWEHPYVVQELR